MTSPKPARPASIRDDIASADPEVRRRAAQQVAQVPAPESFELLVLILGDSDWRVRKEATLAAVQLEPRTAAVFALTNILGERENVSLRNAAVEALVAIGPDAVAGAIAALSRLDADGRKLAVEVLAQVPTPAGVRALCAALGDPDENVCVAAAEGLGSAHWAGDDTRELATAALQSLLASSGSYERLAALDALRKLGCIVPWSVLESLLSDPLLRRTVLAAAAGSRSSGALAALAQGCEDDHASVAREAVLALGRSMEDAWEEDALLAGIGSQLRASPKACARLRALAVEGDVPTRCASLLALGVIRDVHDAALLTDALGDNDVAEHAEAALQRFGLEAVDSLIAAGHSRYPSLRGAAISVLPHLGRTSESQLRTVRAALSDMAAEVVVPALASLAALGDPSDFPTLARHMQSGPAVAGGARRALVAIASRYPTESRAHLSGINPQGEHAEFAAVLIEALARASQGLPEDGPFLASVLAHDMPQARKAAIDALAALGTEQAARIVSGGLTDEDVTVAHATIRALGLLRRGEELASLAAKTRERTRLALILRALGEADPERAFAAAQPHLRSHEPFLASAAIEVVGAIAGEARGRALMNAIGHEDVEVVKLALARLSEKHGDLGFAALAHAMDHPAEAVRKYAAELLGGKGIAAKTLLQTRLDLDTSAEVRRAIMEALANRLEDE